VFDTERTSSSSFRMPRREDVERSVGLVTLKASLVVDDRDRVVRSHSRRT
jgi:hypothetical protein